MKTQQQHFLKMTALLLVGACITSYAYAQTDPNVYVDEYKRRSIRKRIDERPGRTSYLDTKAIEEKMAGSEQALMLQQLTLITGQEETGYTISPGDTMTVTFLDRNAENTATYIVSNEGEIFLPLIGACQVNGLNRKEARTKIQTELEQYIRNPEVTVSINSEGRFFLLGAVTGPGIYHIRPNLSLAEAIYESGGFNEKQAKKSSIIVFRGDLKNPVVMRLDLQKMIRRGDRTDNVLIKPGDIVYVPTTFISKLDDFKDNFMNIVTDYYTLTGAGSLFNPLNEPIF